MASDMLKIVVKREYSHVQQFFAGRGEDITTDDAYLEWWKRASKEDIIALVQEFVRPMRPVVGYLPDPEQRCPAYVRFLESAPPPEMDGKHVRFVLSIIQGTMPDDGHRMQITIYETVRDDPLRDWQWIISRRDKDIFACEMDPEGW
jgi:hypothetical protein